MTCRGRAFLSRLARPVAVGLALAAALFWVAGVQAAVFAGSKTDPSGDVGIFGGDFLPNPVVDVTNVSVRYDDVAGRVDVSFTFTQAPQSYQSIRAGVALGSRTPGGLCVTPFFISLGWHGEVPGLIVEGNSSDFGGKVTGTLWNEAGQTVAQWERTAWFEWPGARATWNFATSDPQLVGGQYRCASAGVSATGTDSPAESGGVSEESGPDFELIAEPSPVAPSTGPPLLLPAPLPAAPPPKPVCADGVDNDGDGTTDLQDWGCDRPGDTSENLGAAGPLLTVYQGKEYVRERLRQRFRTRFVQRRAYTIVCRRTLRRQLVCDVKWRVGLRRYQGPTRVTLTAAGEGVDVTVDVSRVRYRIDRPRIVPRSSPSPSVSPAGGSSGSNCDPNYTGACLDPTASDYDCLGGSGNGPYFTGRVTVVGVDRFGLDGDGDGIGCE